MTGLHAFRPRFRLLPLVLLFLALHLAGGFAAAEQRVDAPPSRLRALSSVLRFFTWHAAGSSGISKALEFYGNGRLFDVLAATAETLNAPATEPFHEEAYLIRALALADLGWREQAAQSFAAVLETEGVSPYYPLALLGLIESYHADGRFDAVVEAYGRYFEKPWKGSDRRSLLLRNRFFAYGRLRTAGSRITREEEDLLAKRDWLSEKLHERKERPSERLLYLAGLDLFRVGRYSESLRALERIGMMSFYYPYALYTSAQNLHALGRDKRARKKIETLLNFPPTTVEESVLAGRAGLLRAQLIFESGSLEGALAAAGTVGGDSIYALQARLFRAEICLAADKPSLAVAYYRDLGKLSSGPRLEAERALGLASAYSALGDFPSAAATLKSAADLVARARAAIESADLDGHAATLRALAEDEAKETRGLAYRRRQRLAAGIRRVMDFKGPMNLGKIARVVFTSHRDTVIGEPVYDLRLLAEAEESRRPEPASGEGLWFDYLKSPLRPSVEAGLSSLLGTEDEAEGAASPSVARTLDLAMKWLEGRYPRSGNEDLREVAAAAAAIGTAVVDGADVPALALAFDLGAPLAPQISEARTRIIAGRRLPPDSNKETIDEGALVTARETMNRAVSESVTLGIRQILQQRGDRLRLLEYDLESALSQAMAEEKGSLASSPNAP